MPTQEQLHTKGKELHDLYLMVGATKTKCLSVIKQMKEVEPDKEMLPYWDEAARQIKESKLFKDE